MAKQTMASYLEVHINRQRLFSYNHYWTRLNVFYFQIVEWAQYLKGDEHINHIKVKYEDASHPSLHSIYKQLKWS